MIVITRALAQAINTLTGKEVIHGKHLGRAFYRGTVGDGTIELKTLPGVGDGTPSDDATISINGQWDTHYFKGGACAYDKEHFFQLITTDGMPQSAADRYEHTDHDTIDPHVATVVIALLFGRDEVGRPLTTDEERLIASSRATSIRVALGTPPEKQRPAAHSITLNQNASTR